MIIFSLVSFVIFSLYIFGNYIINKNNKYLKLIQDKVLVKIVSPNFELKYGLKIEDLENRLKKLVRISDPIKGVKTLFVWPEGVFSGYSYREIIKFERIFSKNFDKDHFFFNITNQSINFGGQYNDIKT